MSAIAFAQKPTVGDHASAISINSPIRRRASLPDISTHISKRPRLDGPPSFPPTHITKTSVPGDRPIHDPMADAAYRRQVLAELRESSMHATPCSHGERTDKLVRQLLEKAEHPNTDRGRGTVEALFCAGDEAATLVESTSPGDAPIFTKGQQQFRWRQGRRPIEQFFGRMVVLNKSVSVQIPSRRATANSFEVRKLREVRERFLNNSNTDEPWNILDLQTPFRLTWDFLNGENCQLLLQVRNTALMGQSAERVSASTQQWKEWTNVLDWALLSEGGHSTEPHTDSHGFSTCITSQEGQIGIGWMSHPTEEEREAWMAEPLCYTGGRWRYVVLKPDQSVFFLCRARFTLFFGCDSIKHWRLVVTFFSGLALSGGCKSCSPR